MGENAIDTRVSPTIDGTAVHHAAAARGGAGFTSTADPAVVALAAAVATMRNEGTRLSSYRDAVLADETMTKGAAALEFAGLEKKSTEAVLKAAGAAEKSARETLAALRQEIDAPILESARGKPLAAEVRAHFAKMKNSDRVAKARALIASDMESASAVLGAPGFLSGLDDETHQALAAELRRARMPNEVARAEAIEGALEAFGRALQVHLETSSNMQILPAKDRDALRVRASRRSTLSQI